MDVDTLKRVARYVDLNGAENIVNKNENGLYEDGEGNVIENFLETFYGKTVSMTRCEFDNYLLKCIAEMSEFMAETTKHVEGLNHLLNTHIETTNDVLDQVVEEINIIKNIQPPDEQDVYLINRRLEILANKLELLAKQTGKLDVIKGFLSNAFPGEEE